MDSYLYYKRGEEWVRVNADSYSTETEPSEGGQCPTFYGYTINFGYLRFGVTTQRQIVRNCTSSQRFLGPMSLVWTSKTISVQNPTQTLLLLSAVGTSDTITSASITYAICGLEPDNCGPPGACKTLFQLNGSTVLTLNECPEVMERDSCSDCCAELLPIARRISI